MAGKPGITVDLEWQGELRFEGASGAHPLSLDGDAIAGISPMRSLAAALAGCMAVDVVHILERMRTPPESLRVHLEGERADDDPRRFVRLHLEIHIGGEVPARNVARALELSRDTYCSVWHSLRQDIDLTTDYEVVAEGG